MAIASKTLELFGQSFALPASKVAGNAVRIPFVALTHEWASNLDVHFLELFENLDQLYSQADSLADEVRSKAVSDAMKVLAEFGIYDLTEQDFYSRFMVPYDRWSEAFDPVASQYEAIVERTAEQDAYRTARRQNRRMWVGYGSTQAVYDADGKNFTSNIAHGVFNLVAKGVTAIGNTVKKNEILRNPATKKQVIDGVCGLVEAANLGLVDAINAEAPDSVHQYSDEEISKVDAIVANVRKDRIPANDVLRTLIRGIQVYPYNIDVYTLLLERFGSDGGRLSAIAEYFGIVGWNEELQRRFEEKRSKVALATVEDCRVNLPDLLKFASSIGYEAFAAEADNIRQAAAKSDFDQKVKSADLRTLAATSQQAKAFEAYANQIGYGHFSEAWQAVVARATETEFLAEAGKYSLATIAQCDQALPTLKSFASGVGYAGFEEWAAGVRARAVASDQAIAEAGRLRARKMRRRLIWLLVIGGAVGWVMYRHAQVEALREQRRAAFEAQARQEQAQQAPEPSPSAPPPPAPEREVAPAAQPEPAITSPPQDVLSNSTPAAEVSLPFIGERTFNFAGGNGTEEQIKIEADGRTTIQGCGSNCVVEYQGPFANPMWATDPAMKGYGWSIQGDQITQLKDGSVVNECGDDGASPCVKELYPFDSGTSAPPPKAAVDRDALAAAQSDEWTRIKSRIDLMGNQAIYIRQCVQSLVAVGVQFGQTKEEASEGINERCEQLVNDVYECGGISPSRPARCTQAR